MPTSHADPRPWMGSAPKAEPSSIDLKKGKWEKVKGTRIQCLPGKVPVRIVIADGKQFDPANARGARMHVAKLAEKAVELARIRGEPAPADAAALVRQGKASKSKLGAAEATAVVPAEGTAEQTISKKARRAQEREKIRELGAAAHASELAQEGRDVVSQDKCIGEVVQRSAGRAWIRLRSTDGLPEPFLPRLREQRHALRELASEAVKGNPLVWSDTEDVLPLRFADAQQGLNLQPGVAIKCHVYTSASGLGVCEAEAAPSELASTTPTPAQPKAEPPKNEPQSKRALKRQRAARRRAQENAGPASAPEGTSKRARKGAKAPTTTETPAGDVAAEAAQTPLAATAEPVLSLDAAPLQDSSTKLATIDAIPSVVDEARVRVPNSSEQPGDAVCEALDQSGKVLADTAAESKGGNVTTAAEHDNAAESCDAPASDVVEPCAENCSAATGAAPAALVALTMSAEESTISRTELTPSAHEFPADPPPEGEANVSLDTAVAASADTATGSVASAEQAANNVAAASQQETAHEAAPCATSEHDPNAETACNEAPNADSTVPPTEILRETVTAQTA